MAQLEVLLFSYLIFFHDFIRTEVRHKYSSSTAKSFPSPIVGSAYEVSTIKLLNENVLNIVSQFNGVKDNWNQNYSALTAIISDIDQVITFISCGFRFLQILLTSFRFKKTIIDCKWCLARICDKITVSCTVHYCRCTRHPKGSCEWNCYRC